MTRLSDPYPVHIDEVDGLATTWAELPVLPTASLIFRRGWADETFSTKGQTHLLEHVVCPWPGSDSVGVSATVTEYDTIFTARGTISSVQEALRTICSNLTEIPVARIEPEREACWIEGSGDAGALGELLADRYGVVGLGLIGCQDLGLSAAGSEQLQALATAHFTRKNAALSMTFRPTDEWRLPLPDGSPQPIQPVSRRPERSSPWFVHGSELGMSWEADRSSANFFLARALTHRLWIEMRESGLSYDIDIDGRVASASGRWVAVFIDCRGGTQHRTHEMLHRVISSFVENGLSPDEAEAVVRWMTVELLDPRDAQDAARRQARALLRGDTPASRLRRIEEFREAQDELAQAAKEAMSTAAFVQPRHLPAPDGAHELPLTWSDPLVSGVQFDRVPQAPNDDDEVARVTIGEDGISLVEGSGHRLTCRWHECVGVTHGYAGLIRVHHVDGRWMDFPSTAIERGHYVVGLLHKYLGDRVVPAGPDSDEWDALVELASQALDLDVHGMDLTALQRGLYGHEFVIDVAVARFAGRQGVLASTTLGLRWVSSARREIEPKSWWAPWDGLQVTAEDDDGACLMARVDGQTSQFEAVRPRSAVATIIDVAKHGIWRSGDDDGSIEPRPGSMSDTETDAGSQLP